MVVVVFRSYIRSDGSAGFHELADKLLPIAESMPGFISYKVFVAEDDERCSIIEFETAEQLEAWRDLAVHAKAQETGRERFYERYSLQVTEPVRESRFDRSQST